MLHLMFVKVYDVLYDVLYVACLCKDDNDNDNDNGNENENGNDYEENPLLD